MARAKQNKPNQSDKTVKRKPLHNPISVMPRRVRLLFLVIFILFVALIVRLFMMQVLHKKYYEGKLKSTSTAQVVEAAPRGNIYDAKGNLLAATAPVQAIEFTRGNNVTASAMRKLAENLAPMLPADVATGTLSLRDKKDFYLADPQNMEKVNDSLTKQELQDEKGLPLTGAKLYQAELAKVDERELALTAKQEVAAKLFKEMNGTAVFNTTVIAKGNVTAAEQAKIAEHERELPGIRIGTTWDRKYSQNSLTDILGGVTSQKQGIPADLLDDYLKKGYLRNDRVGNGLLELGYEQYLQGKHGISQVTVGQNGTITNTEVLQKAQRGNDLKLTVDLDFQNGVDKILQDELTKTIGEGFGAYSSGAYAVVINSKTGAILALSGLDRDAATGKMTPDTLATFTKAYEPGSVVKMGTITAAWQNKVISGNATLNDQPIQFAGSAPIESWFTKGILPITAVQALEYSSNTYMVQLALKMLGQDYKPNMTIDTTNRVKVYEALRKVYASYGMGTKTGFDIPGEATGLITPTSSQNATVGNLLYESFGQFDTYTPLQLAVYANTLANNGVRRAPHIVQGVYENDSQDKLGKLVKTIDSPIVDKVDVSAENMAILKEGMYQVVHGGLPMATGYYMGQGTPISISAKTGTSQSYTKAPDGSIVPVTAGNAVAFAPSNDPQISIAVMVPNLTVKSGGTTSEISSYITRDIVNLYNKMYKFK